MALGHHTKFCQRACSVCCEPDQTFDFRFLHGSQAFEVTCRFEAHCPAAEPSKYAWDPCFPSNEQGCDSWISLLQPCMFAKPAQGSAIASSWTLFIYLSLCQNVSRRYLLLKLSWPTYASVKIKMHWLRKIKATIKCLFLMSFFVRLFLIFETRLERLAPETIVGNDELPIAKGPSFMKVHRSVFF
jgi:hypothetical protein